MRHMDIYLFPWFFPTGQAGKWKIACSCVENVPIIERIIDIFPNFSMYVKCLDEKKV